MQTVTTWLTVFWLSVGSAAAQQAAAADDLSKGRYLAVMICATCHAVPDHPQKPLLDPPAPSLASIAQRKDADADSLAKFLATTHRNLANPKGMPNPDLAAYQVKEVVAYLLSLRK